MSDNVNKKYLDYLDYQHYIYEKRDFEGFRIDRKAEHDVPVTGYTYVFFTMPEMAVTPERCKFGYGSEKLYDINSRALKLPRYSNSVPVESIYSKHICNSLGGIGTPYINIFTNRCSNIPAEDQELATMDYGETYSRYKILLGTTTKDSRIGGNVTFKFREDQYLNITKIVKLWVEYIEGLYRGDVISVTGANMTFDSLHAASIDYMCSIFCFNTLPDGKTLTYWSKYTGCFPTNIPYGVHQGEDGTINGINEVEVKFAFAFKEDLDPQILRDFNLIHKAHIASYGDPNSLINDPNSNEYHDGQMIKSDTFKVEEKEGEKPGIPYVYAVPKSERADSPQYCLALIDKLHPSKDFYGKGVQNNFEPLNYGQ